MGEVLSLLFMMCRPESWEQLGVDGANVKIELTDRLIAERATTYRHNPSSDPWFKRTVWLFE